MKHLIYNKLKQIANLHTRLVLKETKFPPEVWIENTNCCNAKCIMCPRDTHIRKLGFMNFALYEKLIKEIAKFSSTVKRVHLHNFGEPLLDKDLARRIKLAKAHNISHVYFVANAHLLTQDKSEEIINAGLDGFKISFYGTDADTYANTMVGLDFDTTLRNIKDFFKIRNAKNKHKPSVIIQYVPHENNKGKISEFFNLFDGLIDKRIGDKLYIFPLHNYGGAKSHVRLRERISSICNYPWRTMVIQYDGKVVPCPLDYNGFLTMGDANTSTIQQIWNSPEYNRMRQLFKKLQYNEYKVCPNCDMPHF